MRSHFIYKSQACDPYVMRGFKPYYWSLLYRSAFARPIIASWLGWSSLGSTNL